VCVSVCVRCVVLCACGKAKAAMNAALWLAGRSMISAAYWKERERGRSFHWRETEGIEQQKNIPSIFYSKGPSQQMDVYKST